MINFRRKCRSRIITRKNSPRNRKLPHAFQKNMCSKQENRKREMAGAYSSIPNALPLTEFVQLLTSIAHTQNQSAHISTRSEQLQNHSAHLSTRSAQVQKDSAQLSTRCVQGQRGHAQFSTRSAQVQKESAHLRKESAQPANDKAQVYPFINLRLQL